MTNTVCNLLLKESYINELIKEKKYINDDILKVFLLKEDPKEFIHYWNLNVINKSDESIKNFINVAVLSNHKNDELLAFLLNRTQLSEISVKLLIHGVVEQNKINPFYFIKNYFNLNVSKKNEIKMIAQSKDEKNLLNFLDNNILTNKEQEYLLKLSTQYGFLLGIEHTLKNYTFDNKFLISILNIISRQKSVSIFCAFFNNINQENKTLFSIDFIVKMMLELDCLVIFEHLYLNYKISDNTIISLHREINQNTTFYTQIIKLNQNTIDSIKEKYNIIEIKNKVKSF